MFDLGNVETHPDFRFLSRRTRDVISGVMLMVAAVGLIGLTVEMLLLLGRLLYMVMF